MLIENAYYILTPTPQVAEEKYKLIKNSWKAYEGPSGYSGLPAS